MSKLLLSYLFKTSLANFRTAIIEDNTDRICRILDIERDYLNKCIDSEGNTALLLAIEYASPLTFRLLLEQGAAPDQANTMTSQTPLGLLVSKVFDDYHSNGAQKILEKARILLDRGAYVDKPSTRVYQDEFSKEYTTRETPLMTAVRLRNLPMVRLLIANKANVNYTERQSRIRPIHYAIENGDEPMFDLLESAGAYAHSVVSNGDENLIHWFCSNQSNDSNMSLLEKLIERGCDINAENWEQRTPIFIAVKNDMINTCRILIQSDAQLNMLDAKGYRPMDLALPTSQCFKLFQPNLQRKSSDSSSQNASPVKSNSARLRRHRLDFRRRFTTDLSGATTNSPSTSSKHSDQCETDDEQKGGTNVSPYIYPNRQRDSDDMDTKYERMWEKLRQKREVRRVLRSSSRQRTPSIDISLPDPL